MAGASRSSKRSNLARGVDYTPCPVPSRGPLKTIVMVRHARWLDSAVPMDDIERNNTEDCRRFVRPPKLSVENVRVHQASSLAQASCTSYSVFSKSQPR